MKNALLVTIATFLLFMGCTITKKSNLDDLERRLRQKNEARSKNIK